MNDRYLYRAKRKNWRELPKEKWWVEGYYAHIEAQDRDVILVDSGGILFVDIDPSTICQCTGLKDKHGKLIFENDIVKRVDRRNDRHIFCEQPSMNCKVVWTYNYGFDTLPSCGHFDKSDGLECEIVGNIFDNPELLGVGL